MKRRTALLAMLGAIPGLGFLKQRKAAHPCACGNCDACEFDKYEIVAGEWQCEQDWGIKVIVVDPLAPPDLELESWRQLGRRIAEEREAAICRAINELRPS